MPRKTSQTLFDTTGTVRTPLEDIPKDVKDFVEEVYAKQRKRPSRERVPYDTEAELKAEWKLMVDYCAQRPQGILKVRRSPSKDLPPSTMDIRIVADVEANGARNAGNDRREPANAPKNK
jgi:hypothetical protein